MEHSCTLVVRSYECDSYGHVNNAVYLNYLEYARHEYLKWLGISSDELRDAGYGLWVAQLRIEYRKPAKMDDALTILTRPLRRRLIGGVLGQRILCTGDRMAEAEVTWVCVDSRGRPSPLPAVFEREGLAP
jgi:acyl-CoA thioester hydrolase